MEREKPILAPGRRGKDPLRPAVKGKVWRTSGTPVESLKPIAAEPFAAALERWLTQPRSPTPDRPPSRSSAQGR